MDEAGTAAKEPVTIVVGLIVNADETLMLAETAINEVLGAVPDTFRPGFIFHATDIAGNPRYRAEWSMPDRQALLKAMMRLPRRLGIAISLGMVRRNAGAEQWILDRQRLRLEQWHHLQAFWLCVSKADKYIREYADLREVATIVAEDVPVMRSHLRQVPTVLRDHPLVLPPGMLRPTLAEQASGRIAQESEMRVTRIRRAVHFATKQDEPLLQLADACAFGFRRFFAELPGGLDFVRAILGQEPPIEDFRGPMSGTTAFGHPAK